MSSNAHKEVIYSGQYRHGVDPKNRITIPASWRSGDPEGEAFYVIVNSAESCIVVMPPAEFRRIKESYASHPDLSPRDRQLAVRQFAANALECTADKSGRMVLPPEFCSRVGYNGEAVLVGSFERFEVWNVARWAADQEEIAPTYLNAASKLGL